MEHLKYILFIMTAMMLSSSSCASEKSIENCEIKKVLKVTAESDGSYYMHIKFSRCASKELRENLVKEELRNRFPLIGNRTIYVEEYLGKMYNEYKYEIKVESVSSFGQVRDFNDIPKEILEQLDKMGNDLSSTLNACECTYLDYYFQGAKGTFSFCEKKICFFRGNVGTIKSSKKEYFEEIKQIINTGVLPSLGMQQLIVFDECESKYIGYEAIIVLGGKKYLTKKDIIKRLKNN